MNEKKARHIYYLRGLTPALIIFLSLYLFGASLFSLSTFLICYLWPYFIFTPGAKRRYHDYKYRWSFVGMMVRLQEVVENGLPGNGFRKSFSISIIAPVLLCLVLWALTFEGEPLFALGGSAAFSLVYRFFLHPIASANYLTTLETDLNDPLVGNVSAPDQPVQNHQTDNDLDS